MLKEQREIEPSSRTALKCSPLHPRSFHRELAQIKSPAGSLWSCASSILEMKRRRRDCRGMTWSLRELVQPNSEFRNRATVLLCA